jgi:hypothetical protein
MITITINGLDQFITARLSKEMSKELANLYEVSEDEINFIAPQSMVFHSGVEQTSWHVIVDVKAPLKVKVVQKHIGEFIIASLKDVAINIEVLFTYFSSDDHIEQLNKDYPSYISERNIVRVEDEIDEEDDEDEEHHHHHHDNEDEEELFTGNIFEGLDDGSSD